MFSCIHGFQQGLDGGVGAAGLLSSSLQGMTTFAAFNMQEKLADDYRQASEVIISIILSPFFIF